MITARDLFCLYPVPAGTVTALRGLSLSVPAGERLVVHGPNGSGKTTLLKVLMGEQAPSAGTVEVAGVDLGGADERTRARLRLTRLGIVDQHSARALRPELTVLDNVALQLRVAGTRRTAARQAAADVLASFGLDGLAERRPASLAGGEAQRIAVCAALAHHPAVVLADEPTGDLDTDTADAVYDLLAAAVARAGATLLLVSHDTRAARIADRVVRIRDGRLSEQWAPAEPEDEILVVDDRGWVRLPEQLRQRTGAAGGVRAAGHGDRIVLSAVHDGPGRSGPGRPLDAVPPRTPGAVVACARGVRVRLGGRDVLVEVEADVRAGALTVVRGPSGSGKSTLLRALLGLLDVDAGFVELAGTGLAGLDRARRADVRRACAAVSLQGGALAEPLDVEENLALARTARGLPPDSALVTRVLTDLGLTPVRGRAVAVLSGGERQRVGVARCLAVERALLVLDEPTSQQDEAHAEQVSAALARAAAGGSAVLAASHDPVLLDAADAVIDLT